MSTNSAAAAETTPLLTSSDHQDGTMLDPSTSHSSDAAQAQETDDAVGAQSTKLDPSAKRALISVFVANLLGSLAHYVAISCILDLIRGLTCQEYYLRQVPQSNTFDCSLIDIQDRASTVFSFMLSIN